MVSLEFTSRAALRPAEVAYYLTSGITTGVPLGPDLAIDSRDPTLIHFSHRSGILRKVPDRGEFLLSGIDESGKYVDGDEAAGTLIRCRLWCGGMRRRGLLLAALAGILAATAGALAFGWLITVSIPLGVGVALLADLLIWRSQRVALRRRVEGYLSSLRYLDRDRPETS